MAWLKNFLIFCSGAAAGGAAAFFSVKTFYKKKADERVEKEVALAEAVSKQNAELLKKALEKDAPAEKEEPATPSVGETVKYNNILEEMRYSQHQSIEREAAKALDDFPHTVDPNDVERVAAGYARVDLMYFADEVLTDTELNPLSDAHVAIGDDNLKLFGEYGDATDETIYILNKADRKLYIVHRDYRDYEEAVRPR